MNMCVDKTENLFYTKGFELNPAPISTSESREWHRLNSAGDQHLLLRESQKDGVDEMKQGISFQFSHTK